MSLLNVPTFGFFLIFILASQNFCLATSQEEKEDDKFSRILTPAKRLNKIKDDNEHNDYPDPTELAIFFEKYKTDFKNYKTLEKRISKLINTYKQQQEQNPKYYFGTIFEILKNNVKFKP
ncbi:hypothetical protein IM40_03830 [Candidatus Paracaedimonas acanthamoebae]|nr:hypothetical protein IM40_03830 [Candidatus Paracaedimonas acanthamoebae]